MITVALVDDHHVTRKGIKTIIESNPEIEVIIESFNGIDFFEKLSSATALPEIVLLDINMPLMNGYSTTEKLKIKYPSIKIIVFSLLDEEGVALNVINHGASAFINKSIDPLLIADVIIEVSKYGYYINEFLKKEQLKKLPIGRKKKAFIGRNVISEKELEFIRLSPTNLTLKEMAVCMKVSPKTIENYRDSLFQKLKVKNRAALVMYGFKNGLIDSFRNK